MKNIFFILLVLSFFNVSGQVLFTKRPLSVGNQTRADTVRQSTLRVTFLGRPFTEIHQAEQAALTDRGGEETDWWMEADSLAQELLQLQSELQSDSTRLGGLNERFKGGQTIGSLEPVLDEGLPFADVPSVLPIRIGSWRDFRLSSGFGIRFHPVLHRWLRHDGLDFPLRVGTDVYATADGWVDRVGYDPGGLGLSVTVRHLSGYTTLYAHLSDREVMPGQWVGRGERIARSGNTGRSIGPHLHYAIRQGDRPVNPVDFCFLLLRWAKTVQKGRTTTR